MEGSVGSGPCGFGAREDGRQRVNVFYHIGNRWYTNLERWATSSGIGLAVAWLLLGTGVGRAATVTVDGGQTYQVIDGFGVNANHRNWINNELQPVLDAFIDQAGLTLFRVVYDKTDWEVTNVYNPNPTNINWSYYNTVYSNADFEAMWGLTGYLNQRGITNGVMFNLQGSGPSWMADTALFPGYEDQWAEMVASLLIHARKTRHLQFGLVAPDNEPDNFADSKLQGIYMTDMNQYVTALHDLAIRLDSNGLSDLRFVGPDLAYTSTDWLSAMMDDPLIMGKLAHFGLHSYLDSGGGSSGVYDFLQSSDYPDRNFWVTEFNVPCASCETCSGGIDSWDYAVSMAEYLLAHLSNGASAGLVWEGYDSYYNILNCWSYWGLFAVDDINAVPKTYTPRKQFYTLAQISKFVRPGARRIDASGSTDPLILLAFYHPSNGQITLTGINTDTSQAVLFGTLTNLPAATTMDLYYTSSDTNLASGGSFPVSGGTFTAVVPADCVFTLRAHILIGPLAQISVTPANAALLPRSTFQFTATGSDALGVQLNPQPVLVWSVSGGGTIDTNGLFTTGAASGGPFRVSASSGTVTGTALVNVSADVAFSGAGYTWYSLARPTDGSPQTAAPGLNDGDINTDVPLFPGGGPDGPNAYEGAGVVWSAPQTIGQVRYINGSYDPQANGVFEAAFGLQFSPDGLTWSNAGPEWMQAPAYTYDSPASANSIFSFIGGIATVQGVRCVGQVHSNTTGPSSWVAFATEVQAFPPPLPQPVLTVTSGANGLAISWPVLLTNYALESTAYLGRASVWTAVTNLSRPSGALQTIIVQPTSGHQFFRLRLQ